MAPWISALPIATSCSRSICRIIRLNLVFVTLVCLCNISKPRFCLIRSKAKSIKNHQIEDLRSVYQIWLSDLSSHPTLAPGLLEKPNVGANQPCGDYERLGKENQIGRARKNIVSIRLVANVICIEEKLRFPCSSYLFPTLKTMKSCIRPPLGNSQPAILCWHENIFSSLYMELRCQRVLDSSSNWILWYLCVRGVPDFRPKSLKLLTAIERCRPQMSETVTDCFDGRSDQYSEQTSSEGPVLEEFIPMKRTSYTNEDGGDGQQQQKQQLSHKPNNICSKDKSSPFPVIPDWLTSAQLSTQALDPPIQEVGLHNAFGSKLGGAGVCFWLDICVRTYRHIVGWHGATIFCGLGQIGMQGV